MKKNVGVVWMVNGHWFVLDSPLERRHIVKVARLNKKPTTATTTLAAILTFYPPLNYYMYMWLWLFDGNKNYKFRICGGCPSSPYGFERVSITTQLTKTQYYTVWFDLCERVSKWERISECIINGWICCGCSSIIFARLVSVLFIALLYIFYRGRFARSCTKHKFLQFLYLQKIETSIAN